ncbi:uncharacterized protein LOC133037075 [Cannabis sativa]|uniref:uncharacterized protein LOC133037075 n=1 Tax=Cannabis sativa TaxID=3483 RepID=UPI0029CA39A8|nr:uncharacterized protein LOC133037075 [Cannabis sativa]
MSSSTTSNPGITATAAMATPPNPPWNLFSHSLTSNLTIKLDRHNFLSWKSQVIPTVIGHDLDEILFTGTSPPQNLVNGARRGTVSPPLIIVNSDPLLPAKPASKDLYQQISQLLPADPSASNSYICCSGGALEQKFSSQTKARLLQLKGQFSHLNKGNLSISEYVEKVQTIADVLTVARAPVKDQDLVLQVLNGLGTDFDSVVSGITARSDNLTIDEVQALLLSHESRLEHHHQMNDLSMKMQANLAFGSGRSGGVRPYSSNRSGN